MPAAYDVDWPFRYISVESLGIWGCAATSTSARPMKLCPNDIQLRSPTGYKSYLFSMKVYISLFYEALKPRFDSAFISHRQTIVVKENFYT